MKTHIILLELTQESDNINWLEMVLLSGLNPGESVTLQKLSEVPERYQELTDVLNNFNLSLDPVNLYNELENLLDLVNELKQDINTLNDLLAK